MAETSQDKLQEFWQATARRFAASGLKAVCTPTSIGLVNWYHDILQKTALKPIFVATKNARVLEVGCGVGRWSSRLLKLGAHVVGIDFAASMVKEALRRQQTWGGLAKADFMIARATSLPFSDSSFDYALCVTVLQHIIDEVDAKKAVSEVVRVVKSGGKIIILEISCVGKQRISQDFPTASRSATEWIALFTEGQRAELQRVDGVDLSFFAKPLYGMKSKFARGTEYVSQLAGNTSLKLTIIKGAYYTLLNIALLLSLPLDLLLRGKLVNQCTHRVFIFRKN